MVASPSLPKANSSRFYLADTSSLQVTNLDKAKSTSDIDLARNSALASLTPPPPSAQESEEKKVPFQDPRVPNVSSSPLKAKSLPRSMNYAGAVMKKAKKSKKGGLGRVKSLGLVPASNVLARLGIRMLPEGNMCDL